MFTDGQGLIAVPVAAFLAQQGRDTAAEYRKSARLQGLAFMAKVIKAAIAADRMAENAPVPRVLIETVEAVAAGRNGCAVHSAGCYEDAHYAEAGAGLML